MNLKESTCTWYIYYYIISNEICQNNFKCQKWSTNLHIHLYRATNQYLLRNIYIAKKILFMPCSKKQIQKKKQKCRTKLCSCVKLNSTHTHKNIVNQIINIVILNYNVSKNRTTEFRLWAVWLDDHQRGFVATRSTDSCTTAAFARCYVSTSSKDTRWFFSK